MDAAVRRTLQENLARVEERITAACARARRARSEVTLVAVTKTVEPNVAAVLAECGALNLGESRPQELWRKAAGVTGPIRWHLIGHLQRNKIERTLPLVEWIHSVDSTRLLQALDREAAKQDRRVNVLLEVNASGEAAKHGIAPTDLGAVTPTMHALTHVQVRGLMTMAALQDAEACRPTFAMLRELRSRLYGEFPQIEHLSMGMSNDFEVAIEEGATMVRLGTVLFEGLS